jgi:hypothetical protein
VLEVYNLFQFRQLIPVTIKKVIVQYRAYKQLVHRQIRAMRMDFSKEQRMLIETFKGKTAMGLIIVVPKDTRLRSVMNTNKDIVKAIMTNQNTNQITIHNSQQNQHHQSSHKMDHIAEAEQVVEHQI